jgi:hypothetical protein
MVGSVLVICADAHKRAKRNIRTKEALCVLVMDLLCSRFDYMQQDLLRADFCRFVSHL